MPSPISAWPPSSVSAPPPSSADASAPKRGSVRAYALGLAALVILLDQLSKWLILAVVMQPPRQIEVLPFFNLVLTYNRGISFGMLSGDSPWQPFLLAGLALVIVAGLLIWLFRQDGLLASLAIGLIVGGALGNVIDRMIHPGVVDFLDFHVAGWHWPAFNMADSAITVGVILLLLDGLFWDRERAK